MNLKVDLYESGVLCDYVFKDEKGKLVFITIDKFDEMDRMVINHWRALVRQEKATLVASGKLNPYDYDL